VARLERAVGTPSAQGIGMERIGMERVTDLAAAAESSAESLLAVLDRARLAQSPAVPPAQLRVLTIVARSRHTNMSRLAEALDVVPSSASRLCDRLEATGLLRRVPDPRDRREVRLLLTAPARRLLNELRDRRRRALGEVLERMTPAARRDLVRGVTAFDAAAAPGGQAGGLRSA
jgi:DNA-binding MarR family transcriptional regulator